MTGGGVGVFSDGSGLNTKSIALQSAITICLQIQISVINATADRSPRPDEIEMVYVGKCFEALALTTLSSLSVTEVRHTVSLLNQIRAKIFLKNLMSF